MFRLIGAAFVILSCTGFGMLKAAEGKKRLDAFYYFKGLLVMLQGEIQYARTPFAEAFENLADKDAGKFSVFLHQLSAQLLKMEGRPFEEIWKEEVGLHLKDSGFLKEDLRQLAQFGERLGYLDCAMQIATIEWQLKQMERKIQELEPELLKKQKIYRYVGAFSGVLIAVTLI